ncbi:hypothetical protein ZHAS_00019194 [Anopheles sinensis]|uniref:Uncharacterized protein n=1 Tax=Anopheles sinensis TaxID=74873 RepID=A0A084WLN8_ANOSI|nr:hypothetical protein ZHAS_00019194 [Anopheles sinensis]
MCPASVEKKNPNSPTNVHHPTVHSRSPAWPAPTTGKVEANETGQRNPTTESAAPPMAPEWI